MRRGRAGRAISPDPEPEAFHASRSNAPTHLSQTSQEERKCVKVYKNNTDNP